MAGQSPQSTPSSSWTPVVKAMYPDILTTTYTVPPVHFNKVPCRRIIVPGTDHVPGIGSVPGEGLPALELQQPLAAGDPLPIHDLTPDCLLPLPSEPSQQPMSSSASQQPVPMSSSASQQPMSSLASQQPMSSSASQQPMSSSANQQPVSSSASQQPVSLSASQQPVSSSASQQPMSSSASQQPMSSSASQQPKSSSASQQPMSPSESQQPKSSSASQQPMSSSANQQPVSSSVSQQPMSSSASQQPVSSSASQQPMSSSASQQPVSSSASQQPMATANQQTMLSSAGQRPMSSPSQQPVSSGSQQPMSSSADQQPLSSTSKQPMSSGSQQPMSPGSQQPVSSSSADQQPLSSGSQQPLSSGSQQPMSSSASQQPVSSGSQQPVSSGSQQPLSSGSQQPMSSSAIQQPLSPGSQQPVSSGSQQPVSSGSQQPVSSSASQQPGSSTPRSFLNMDPLRNLLSNLTQKRGRKQKKQKKQKSILPPVLQTDVNDDEAQAQVLRNLQALAEHGKEVMFIISQLNFTDYLNRPGFAAAAAHLPAIPIDPKTGRKTEGDVDVMVIHRQHGILVGELKTVGKHPSYKSDAVMSDTVMKALKQLNKTKAVVHDLVSDVPSPGLTVRTSLFLPYVSTQQLQRVLLADPQLEKDACSILGAANASEAAQLCCCSDQLSDPSTWWNVTPTDIKNLDTWWRKLMNHTDPMMSEAVYLDVVARFAGPATAITMNCTTRPRVEVKTVEQAVHELGQQLSTLVLTPEQVDIMQQRDKNPLVLLTGPPGTGKTVMLSLVGLCRLRQGKDVHIVSGHDGSRASSNLIKIQLKTTVKSYCKSPSGCGKVFLHHYDLWTSAEKNKAIRELTAIGPDVFLIFDELAQPGFCSGHGLGEPPDFFPDLLKTLRARVNKLRLWAASTVHSGAPPELLKIRLTTPLRSAPSIIREVQKQITGLWSSHIHRYNNTVFPAAGDGMRVERLVHESGSLNGHTGDDAEECFLCGQNLATVLRRLGVGVPGSNIAHRDVLILSDKKWYLRKHIAGDANTTTDDRCRLVQGILHSGLAVRVMVDPEKDKFSWEREVDELAKATGNSIIVTHYDYVHGMERKVVVVLDDDEWLMIFAASRASTQLVVLKTKL